MKSQPEVDSSSCDKTSARDVVPQTSLDANAGQTQHLIFHFREGTGCAFLQPRAQWIGNPYRAQGWANALTWPDPPPLKRLGGTLWGQHRLTSGVLAVRLQSA